MKLPSPPHRLRLASIYATSILAPVFFSILFSWLLAPSANAQIITGPRSGNPYSPVRQFAPTGSDANTSAYFFPYRLRATGSSGVVTGRSTAGTADPMLLWPSLVLISPLANADASSRITAIQLSFFLPASYPSCTFAVMVSAAASATAVNPLTGIPSAAFSTPADDFTTVSGYKDSRIVSAPNLGTFSVTVPVLPAGVYDPVSTLSGVAPGLAETVFTIWVVPNGTTCGPVTNDFPVGLINLRVADYAGQPGRLSYWRNSTTNQGSLTRAQVLAGIAGNTSFVNSNGLPINFPRIPGYTVFLSNSPGISPQPSPGEEAGKIWDNIPPAPTPPTCSLGIVEALVCIGEYIGFFGSLFTWAFGPPSYQDISSAYATVWQTALSAFPFSMIEDVRKALFLTSPACPIPTLGGGTFFSVSVPTLNLCTPFAQIPALIESSPLVSIFSVVIPLSVASVILLYAVRIIKM